MQTILALQPTMIVVEEEEEKRNFAHALEAHQPPHAHQKDSYIS